MAIFRQYIAPLIVVIIFFIALVAASARIFLPADMAAPAPVEQDGGIGILEDRGNSELVSFHPELTSLAAPELFTKL